VLLGRSLKKENLFSRIEENGTINFGDKKGDGIAKFWLANQRFYLRNKALLVTDGYKVVFVLRGSSYTLSILVLGTFVRLATVMYFVYTPVAQGLGASLKNQLL